LNSGPKYVGLKLLTQRGTEDPMNQNLCNLLVYKLMLTPVNRAKIKNFF